MSRKTRPPAQLSRPPLERMMRIHEGLQAGNLRNSTQLATILEVSTKTILRDVVFMRDRLGLPVEYDEKIYAFRYTHPVKAFPTVKISSISNSPDSCPSGSTPCLRAFCFWNFSQMLSISWRSQSRRVVAAGLLSGSFCAVSIWLMTARLRTVPRAASIAAPCVE